MKTLLFALAVAASQVELYLSLIYESGSKMIFNNCSIYFYGNTYSEAKVEFHADLSFSLCFGNSSQRECLLLANHGGADKVDMNLFKMSSIPKEVFNTVPYFTRKPTCKVVVSLQDSTGEYVNFEFIKSTWMTTLSFVARDKYSLPMLDLKSKFGDNIVDSSLVSKNDALVTNYKDLGGCRTNTSIVLNSTPITNADTCTMTMCDLQKANTVNKIGCPSTQACTGNNICVPITPVCTATGSTVVDFFNAVHHIRDMCTYTLMSNTEVAIYMDLLERHLEDVPFLSRLAVFLKVDSTNILLKQGGVVRVGNDILALTSTPQILHGVELSKDATGVTLKTPVTNTIVHFDGDSVHVTGDNVARAGACGNPMSGTPSTSPMNTFVTATSQAGCSDSPFQDVPNTVNCSASNEYCDQMSQDYFAECRDIDPKPFITACKMKACKYTAVNRPVDYMACQYMEAYARACFIKINITLGDWRSQAGCPATRQTYCLSQDCSSHEFCVGEPGCFCRASFSHPRDSIAKPTVCEEGSITVTLPECLLREKGIDPSSLNLMDSTCTGVSDQKTHMLTFLTKGNACGTIVEKTSTKITYKNQIMMGATPLKDIITRHQIVEIDFSCSVPLTESETTSFNIKDSSVVQIMKDAVFEYTLTMSAFTDSGFIQPVDSNTIIDLNQRVWLQMETKGLNSSVVAVVTDSCWATKVPSSTSSLKYDLVIDGCPNAADTTVEMVGNGLGTSNSFSFLMFEFKTVPKVSTVYLHCKVMLCPSSASCAPTCGGIRKRRSARPEYAQGGHALITMVWSN